MTALQLFQVGKLREAIELQARAVQQQPADPAVRLLLAEFLLFNGELDAVREHLAQIPRDIPGMAEYLDAFLLLLVAEGKRQRLLVDVEPGFLLPPPEHISRRLNALEELRNNRLSAAVEQLDEADSCCPWVTGHIDGREFEGIRDHDDLFTSLLEMLVGDEYVWFPFEQVRRLRLDPIASLRDQLFVPAHLTATNGEEWSVHLPTLYPGSLRHANDFVRIGSTTDWMADDDGPIRAVGLRTMTFGEEELTLLDFTQWEKRAMK